MRISSFVLEVVLGIAASAHEAAAPNSHVVHKKRVYLPSRWVRREKIEKRAVLPMRIGLKQRNLERG